MSKFIEEYPVKNKYDELDTTPLAVPFDCKIPETTEQMIERILRASQYRDSLKNGDIETIDEFDDFDIEDDDDFDPVSPYEDKEFLGYDDEGKQQFTPSQTSLYSGRVADGAADHSLASEATLKKNESGANSDAIKKSEVE